MASGGRRVAGEGKKIGRPRLHPEEPIGKMDKGFAARVMNLIGKPEWNKITRETAKNAEEYALTFLTSTDINIAKSFFDRLLDRRYGKPPQPVFNADTRESAPELEYGDLPMPSASESRKTGKPN